MSKEIVERFMLALTFILIMILVFFAYQCSACEKCDKIESFVENKVYTISQEMYLQHCDGDRIEMFYQNYGQLNAYLQIREIIAN